MSNKYAYNPVSGFLDITGANTPANGGGGQFVGVTGLAQGNDVWLRIAQMQFQTDNDETHKRNVCLSSILRFTKQNANPYTFPLEPQSGKLDIHVTIPYIGQSSKESSHYTNVELVLSDADNLDTRDIQMVETAHVIAGDSNYVYCDLFIKAKKYFDRFFYTFESNAANDEYKRIKIIPCIGEDSVTTPGGYGMKRWFARFADATYSASLDNVTTANVVHNMGKYPTVLIVDSDRHLVLADVAYKDKNSVVVEFAESFTGTIYCS